MELTHLQSDVLNELLNIAMGKTASIMSEMINRTILISIPNSKLISRHALKSLFETKYEKSVHQNMLGVTINFSGDCSGSTTLFFEQNQGKTLVDKLLDHQDDEDWDWEGDAGVSESDNQQFFTDSDREALLEIGNMLINGLMGTIGNLLDMVFDYSLPELQVPYRFEEIEESAEDRMSNDTLVLETFFSDQSEEIEGHLIIVFSLGEFAEKLIREIEKLSQTVADEEF